MFLSFVLLLSLTITPARADQDCKYVQDACNKLLTDAYLIIDQQEKDIELRKQQASVLQQNLQISNKAWEEERKRADAAEAWYRSPLLLVPVSILAGFIANQALRTR